VKALSNTDEDIRISAVIGHEEVAQKKKKGGIQPESKNKEKEISRRRSQLTYSQTRADASITREHRTEKDRWQGFLVTASAISRALRSQKSLKRKP